MDGGWFEAGSHLKVTFPTGYVVSKLAWMCEYYRPTLSKLRFEGGGTTSFGSAGSRKNEDLFGGKSAYEWCKREVHWGASWLRKAAMMGNDGTLEGLVVQVHICMHPIVCFSILSSSLYTASNCSRCVLQG